VRNFEVGPDNYDSVSKICRLVEGMPLAIELAAAWVDVLSIDELASEIEKGTDLLEKRHRDAESRHASIENLFNYTWDRLSIKEQSIFMSLSGFRGGFTRSAAEFVAEANIKDLRALTDKSIIKRDAGGRFRIHELLRQYGESKLYQNHELRQRVRGLHTSYYAAFCERRNFDAQAGNQEELLVEIDNIRSAWEWAFGQGDYASIRKMLFSYFWVHEFRVWRTEGYRELKRVKDALERDPLEDKDKSALFGITLMLLAYLTPTSEDREDLMRENISRALGLLEPEDAPFELASVIWGALVMGYSTEFNEARKLYEQGSKLFHSLGLSWGLASMQAAWSGYAFRWSDQIDGERILQEALEIQRRDNNRRGLADGLQMMSNFERTNGNIAKAKELVEESYELFADIGYRPLISSLLCARGEYALLLGDFQEAFQLFFRSYEEASYLGRRWMIGINCVDMSRAKARQGEMQEAYQKLSESVDLFRQIRDRDFGLYILKGVVEFHICLGNPIHSIQYNDLLRTIAEPWWNDFGLTDLRQEALTQCSGMDFPTTLTQTKDSPMMEIIDTVMIELQEMISDQ
jgi:hypothetical protein